MTNSSTQKLYSALKSNSVQKQLTRRMAGEIVISEKPGDTLKKWRTIFKLSQKNLASLLNVKPSVVCDFEKGRRASPGIGTVRKFVEAMVEYDKAQGGKIVSSMFAKDNNNAVYDIREFNTGTAISKLIKDIDGEIRLVGGGVPAPDQNSVIAQSFLEESNVNAVEELVDTLSQQRQFEINVKLIKKASDLDSAGAKLMSLPS